MQIITRGNIMTKTLTVKLMELSRDRSDGTIFAKFALYYRGRLLKEFDGVDGIGLTNRIGRWSDKNEFTAIKWVGPAWYVPSA
jgi:hypothetical protein